MRRSASVPWPSRQVPVRLLAALLLAAVASPVVGLGPGGPAAVASVGSAIGPAAPAAGLPSPARRSTGGGDVTAPELRDLARRASTDAAALAQLRRVRSVDGQPVDIAGALVDARGPALRARLAALAAGAGIAAPSSAGAATAARGAAQQVLRRSKYHPRRLPRPLHGALQWLGDRLDPLLGPVGRAFERAVSTWWGLVLVSGVLLALAVVAAVRLAEGRSRAAATRDRSARGSLVDPTADPDELERLAAAAEVAGDAAAAIRLRYEAGLLRLHRAGVFELRVDTTTGEAARLVARPTFTGLTVTFEEVVYGGRPATAGDVASSRAGWSELVGVGARR